MSWDQYLNGLLHRETELDDITISVDGSLTFSVPPIIKASVLLADDLKSTSRYNSLMFPEKQISSFLYALLRTLYNMEEDRIGQSYDPASFEEGQLLKFNNHVARFLKFELGNGDNPARIWVEFADGVKWSIPSIAAPYFQLTTTSRNLTQLRTFRKDFKPCLDTMMSEDKQSFLTTLSDYKTHLMSTSIYVAPIGRTRNFIQDTLLNGRRAGDVLLFGQTDHEGKIKPISPGQAAGIPALTLAPDLYAANRIIEGGNTVHSIFVQADQTIINSQLSAIDSVIEAGIPITLLSDLTSIQTFHNLECRHFKVWVWNKSYVLPDLVEEDSPIAVKVRNSAEHTVEYLNFDCPHLDRTIRLLNEYSQIIEDTSPNLIPVRNFLYDAAFRNLRAVIPVSNSSGIQSAAGKALEILEGEKRYISQELYSALLEAIENISFLNSEHFVLPKTEAIKGLLSQREKPLYILIPSGTDKIPIQRLLKMHAHGIDQFQIFYPDEYTAFDNPSSGLVIVSGWFNRKIMHKILRAHTAPNILIMLYGIEDEWKTLFKQWDSERRMQNEARNAELLYSIGIFDIPTAEISSQKGIVSESFDELEVIEQTLSRNRYGSYKATYAQDAVDVKPVDYVGNLRTFFRTGRKVITVTGMMYETEEVIKEKFPNELRQGDFVVERATSKDLIREIADRILENSGYENARNTAEMWKETLKIMEKLSGREIVYQNLKAVGCKKQLVTIRTWMDNENMISPSDPKDILNIAKAAGDPILYEKFEDVAAAGSLVRQAHIQAGHYLSRKLKQVLAEQLSSVNFGFPHDIWQPIDLDIETVGAVKILKIVDIGPDMKVDSYLTNRLLSIDKDVAWGGL